jgi:hypothetical protein
MLFQQSSAFFELYCDAAAIRMKGKEDNSVFIIAQTPEICSYAQKMITYGIDAIQKRLLLSN